MKIKYNSKTSNLRLTYPDGRRDCLKEITEIKIGENIFYLSIHYDDLKERLSLLDSKDFSPVINQEVAFIIKKLRQYTPAVVISERRTLIDNLRPVWLNCLREFDINYSRQMKENLEQGGVKEYL